MSDIDVSVIIPTYHRERLVLEAIASVLTQSGVSLEILVLDDSVEGSAAAAVGSVSDPRMRYLKRLQPSGGRPAVVRNQGASLARGRYLHFLDDDDVLESDALRVLCRCLDEQPAAGMAFGAIIPFGDHAAKLHSEQAYFREAAHIARHLRGRMQLVVNLLLMPTILVNSACMVRRESFLSAGGYDIEMPVCEDVDFWMRVARSDDFIYLDRPILHYRTGAPSLMQSLTESDPRRAMAWRRSQGNYRQRYGLRELLLLKLWARTLLRRRS
jgi:glycosyltransferase involved in cell wall biosynthesis